MMLNLTPRPPGTPATSETTTDLPRLGTVFWRFHSVTTAVLESQGRRLFIRPRANGSYYTCGGSHAAS